MKKIYNENGLPFYDWFDIAYRDTIVDVLSGSIIRNLSKENSSWVFERIEAPCIIPSGFISDEYDTEDYFQLLLDPGEYLSLRPETTPSSYAYAKHLVVHQETKPPFCVWQLAKSFRRENDQVSANVRLKEFYQLEFQCIYADGTLNDYQKILPTIADAVCALTGRETRIVESDRLPDYSEKTLDIEVKTPHKWLEVCSSSIRKDVPFDWNGKKLKNVEFAFGIDRLVYAKTLVEPDKKQS